MHPVPWLTSGSSLDNCKLSLVSLPYSPAILPSPKYTLEGNCFPDNCQLPPVTSCLVGNRQSQWIGKSADTTNLHECSQVTRALLCFTANSSRNLESGWCLLLLIPFYSFFCWYLICSSPSWSFLWYWVNSKNRTGGEGDYMLSIAPTIGPSSSFNMNCIRVRSVS